MSKSDLADVVPPQSASALAAGLGRRLCALCYEVLLLIAIVLVLGGIFQLLFPAVSTNQTLRLTLFSYEVVLVWAYFGFCWVKGGQTLAMKTWRITLHRRDATPISWIQALVRYVIVFFATIPLLPIGVWVAHRSLPDYCAWLALTWAALPYLWAFIDKDQQFLHDRIIGARLGFAPRQR